MPVNRVTLPGGPSSRPRGNGPEAAGQLTVPDLILLSLLAERPMHGYQANLELERREVRDWAGISRPQVYYSLGKLNGRGLIRARASSEPAGGPERQAFGTTGSGRAALADALERVDWTEQRDRPAFLTWMALSWQARPGVSRRQIERRRRYLRKELNREKRVLQSVYREVGHRYHEAVWMLELTIAQFKTELRWLKRVESELPARAVVVQSSPPKPMKTKDL
ncbi:MAG TPA: PadR family transcriptional regulator [Candidatus Cybelea sp.]|nr:PadR family transcriptional regulator [Candidatus Cybelea sp.]